MRLCNGFDGLNYPSSLRCCCCFCCVCCLPSHSSPTACLSWLSLLHRLHGDHQHCVQLLSCHQSACHLPLHCPACHLPAHCAGTALLATHGFASLGSFGSFPLCCCLFMSFSVPGLLCWRERRVQRHAAGWLHTGRPGWAQTGSHRWQGRLASGWVQTGSHRWQGRCFSLMITIAKRMLAPMLGMCIELPAILVLTDSAKTSMTDAS